MFFGKVSKTTTGVSREKPQGVGLFFFASLVSDPKNLRNRTLVIFRIREQIFEYAHASNSCCCFLVFFCVFPSIKKKCGVLIWNFFLHNFRIAVLFKGAFSTFFQNKCFLLKYLFLSFQKLILLIVLFWVFARLELLGPRCVCVCVCACDRLGIIWKHG